MAGRDIVDIRIEAHDRASPGTGQVLSELYHFPADSVAAVTGKHTERMEHQHLPGVCRIPPGLERVFRVLVVIEEHAGQECAIFIAKDVQPAFRGSFFGYGTGGIGPRSQCVRSRWESK